jgi:hypothetical protein
MRPIPLASAGSDIQRLLFSRSEVGQAAVLSAVTPNQLFSKKVLRLERYDLERGQPLGVVNLCVDPQYRSGGTLPLDFSGDGTQLALQGRQDPRRVDIWSLRDGRHETAWLPYAQETGVTPSGRKSDRLSWLAFVSSKRLATLNPGGKLVVWNYSDGKALFCLENVLSGSAVLSPGHNFLAVIQNAAVRFYGAANGEPVGVIEWPFLRQTLPNYMATAAAFSADGARLAVAAGGQLACWDVKTGKEICEFDVDPQLTSLTWAGSSHLLGRGGATRPAVQLIDVDQKVVLCSYQLPGNNCPAAGGPDGRLWYASAAGQQSLLHSLAVPDSEAMRVASLVRDPKAPPLLAPGASVAVRVDINCNDTIRRRAAEQLYARLQASGLTPADNAGVVLQLQGTISDTSERLQFRVLGGGMLTVPVQKLTCTVSLGDGKGTPWWKQEISSKTSGGLVRGFRDKEELIAQLTERLWLTGLAFAANLQVPNRVYSANGEALVLPAIVRLGATVPAP